MARYLTDAPQNRQGVVVVTGSRSPRRERWNGGSRAILKLP